MFAPIFLSKSWYQVIFMLINALNKITGYTCVQRAIRRSIAETTMFRFKQIFGDNLRAILYEFASGEVRIWPPVLFCEYGISVPGFGPGRIEVTALAKGSFIERYFEALMNFNDKWHRDKKDNNRIFCGLDFDSYSIDCKFLPLR